MALGSGLALLLGDGGTCLSPLGEASSRAGPVCMWLFSVDGSHPAFLTPPGGAESRVHRTLPSEVRELLGRTVAPALPLLSGAVQGWGARSVISPG